VIKETHKGNAAKPRFWYKQGGKGTGSTIFFNPDKKTGGRNSEGSRERPSFIGLGHELGHAEAYDDGTHNLSRKKNAEGIPLNEENAIMQ